MVGYWLSGGHHLKPQEMLQEFLPNYFFNAIEVENLNMCRLMTIKAIW